MEVIIGNMLFIVQRVEEAREIIIKYKNGELIKQHCKGCRSFYLCWGKKQFINSKLACYWPKDRPVLSFEEVSKYLEEMEVMQDE